MGVLTKKLILLVLIQIASCISQSNVPPMSYTYSRIFNPQNADLVVAGNAPTRVYTNHELSSRKLKLVREPQDIFSGDSGLDDRDFTVGAHYRVADSVPQKPVKLRLVTEEYDDSPQQTKLKPRKKVKLFKPQLVEDDDYDTHRIRDVDPRDFKPNFKLQTVPNLYDRVGNYRKIASRGQIEQYLEDKKKQFDKAIELGFGDDRMPSIKEQYQQLLKQREEERLEQDFIEKFKQDPTRFYQSSSRYARSQFDQRRPQKSRLPPYRGHPAHPGTYKFEVDLK